MFSFRVKLFLATAGLTIVLVAFSMVLVDRSFRLNTNVQIKQEMSKYHVVFDRYQTSKLFSLIALAVNLSLDQRIRGTLATKDIETIRRALAEVKVSQNNDLIWLLDNEGTVIAAPDFTDYVGKNISDRPAVSDAIYGYDSGDIWVINDNLWQVAIVQVFSGDVLVGVLVYGKEFDGWLSREFNELSQLHIAFWQNNKLLATSFDRAEREELKNMLQKWDELDWADSPIIPILNQKSLLGETKVREFSLSSGGNATTPFIGAILRLNSIGGDLLSNVVIIRSMRDEMNLLDRIQFGLMLVGGFIVLISLTISYFLTRSLTHPIHKLVDASNRLGKGDLDTPVIAHSTDEIGKLAIALENMREELKRTRSELLHSERLSTIGSMASAIIHDFRQPMSVISGSLELLNLKSNDEEAQLWTSKALMQMDRMINMVNELLDFAKGQTKLNLQAVNVKEFINNVCDVFQFDLLAKHIELKRDLNSDYVLTMDVNLMQRSIENIIRNAVQASPPHSSITVKLWENQDDVVIEVIDNGSGIPQEVLSKLFDPFFTFGKAKGTGLGLAVTKKVIDEHKGKITVKSAINEGTTFTLTLPKETSTSKLN